MMIGAFGMGICWIFIFGDDPWPDWVEPALGIVVVGAGIIMALVTAWIVFNQLRATDRAGGT